MPCWCSGSVEQSLSEMRLLTACSWEKKNGSAGFLFYVILFYLFTFWQDANIGWGVWKLMTRLLFVTTWWPKVEHTNCQKMSGILICQKLARCISGRLILAVVRQSSLHLSDLPLIATWEHQAKGNRGYFEKMFLKAAYFQANHSLAAEPVRWRS